MTRVALATILVAASIALSLQATSHQTTSADAIVFVQVEDRQGRPIAGLQPRDFVVRVEGEPRPVRGVATGVPLRLAVLVDITASLHRCVDGIAGAPSSAAAAVGPTLATMRGGGLIPLAVEPFELRGLTDRDRVRVGSITRRPALGEPLPGNAPALRSTWRQLFDVPPIEWLGPSPIWDAVADAATQLRGEDGGQRAIVLLTDGHATGNRRGHLDAAQEALAAGVSVNVIVEETVWPAASRDALAALPDPARAAAAVAQVTGGLVGVDRATGLDLRRCFSRDPASVLEFVIDRLRRAYAIRFEPPPGPAGVAGLEVQVARAGAAVRSPQRFRR